MATKRNDKSAVQAVYRKFKKDMSQGTIGSLYIFHGEEAYLRDYYLDQMKAKLIPGGMESFNYHLLPGKGLTAQRLGETVDALPMMSPRTLIVVNDYEVQNREILEVPPLRDRENTPRDVVCLVRFVERLIDRNLITRGVLRPEFFALAPLIVGDHRVCRV